MYRACYIPLLLASIILLIACGDEKSVEVKEFNSDSVATVITRNIKTLISDSGLTQYRLTSQEWQMFEEATEPVWIFPKGLFIEKFDTLFNVAAYIKCDSATYHKEVKLWELNYNIAIQNMDGETMLTQQLFWDQRSKRVYSDKFIHIVRKDRIIEGYGFESNESFTNYKLMKPSGIFPVDEQMMRGKRDSVDIAQQGDAIDTKQSGSDSISPKSIE